MRKFILFMVVIYVPGLLLWLYVGTNISFGLGNILFVAYVVYTIVGWFMARRRKRPIVRWMLFWPLLKRRADRAVERREVVG